MSQIPRPDDNRPIRARVRVAIIVALTATASSSLVAQWPRFPNGTVPRTPDGKVDLAAPTPRTSDGKPDLSGVWETAPCIGCLPPVIDGLSPPAAGRGRGAPGGGAAPNAGRGGPPTPGRGNPFGNVGSQTEGGAPYQPWAADLVKKRMADNSKDNPDAHCLPMGIMQLDSHPYPKKILQTPLEVILIYEASGTTVREVYLDGRKADKEAEPWWNGYSVGHWEGDTLVVETTGLRDDGWLDVRGSPLTSEAKLTERIRRPSYGWLEIAVTIDDPKAYTKPFVATVYNRLSAETQLLEFVCIEKDAAHYVGAAGK